MNRTASAAVYEAARRRAALVDRSDRRRIVISGADRSSYLQGLLTNDIGALSAGSGCYTAYLTAQGRMIADAWVYELGDVILMIVDAGVASTVLAKLDQFIFTEDVQLGDVSETFAQRGIIGPASAAILEEITGVPAARLDSMREHGNMRTELRGAPVIITRTTDAGEPGFDLFVEQSGPVDVDAVLDRAGVPALDSETADAIRVEAGVPKFHRDMDEDTIPLEAGIESRAISFTKGCYVGQEVIIRVMHRGHGRVARRLVGLSMTGDVPPSSVPVRSGEREIGRVTTSAFSPGLQRPIALAYVHRDFVEPGTELNVEGRVAVVSALPFLKPGRP